MTLIMLEYLFFIHGNWWQLPLLSRDIDLQGTETFPSTS